MTVATGGRYWSFNKRRATSSLSMSTMKFTLFVVIPFFTVTGALLAFLINANPNPYTASPSVAGGFGLMRENPAATAQAWLILGAIIVMSVGIMAIALHISPPPLSLLPIMVFFFVSMLVVHQATSFARGVPSDDVKTVAQWVEETYGYKLVSDVNLNDPDVRKVKVHAEHGEEISVDVLRVENNAFLYRNTIELEELLHRINEEKRVS